MTERKLRVAFQMDPPQNLDIAGDSTFALMLEAQKRGYDLWVYDVSSLSMCVQQDVAQPVVSADMHQCDVRDIRGDHVTFKAQAREVLTNMDVVWMRQDPPFDMSYITATHMLDHVHQQGARKTCVVNNPMWVRESPEKLLVTHFPQLMPPTLITWDRREIVRFRQQWKDIIIKPLFGNGGFGVFRLSPEDPNLNALLELFFHHSREPVMVQRYLPEIVKGDKRIILVDGKPAGAVNRVPSGDEHRSNMHVGGQATATTLTPRDHAICDTIGPFLQKHGLVFVGIDVIGDYLTEINVTSPTGLREVENLDNINIASMIWDCIERKLPKR